MNTPSEREVTGQSVLPPQTPQGKALRLLQATAITVLAACGAEPAKPCCPPPCPACGDIVAGEPEPDTFERPDTPAAGPDTLIQLEPDTFSAAPKPDIAAQPDTLEKPDTIQEPDTVTECEKPEHVEMPDPTAKIEKYEFDSPMLNVNFNVTIPDEKCDVPVTVTVMGHVGKNPANRQPGDPTGPVTIPLGSKDVFQSGPDSITTFVPTNFDFLLDAWLVVNDGDGKQVYRSPSEQIAN